MKVLTLHQPWASLVALGVKTIETRSWLTQYRGPLAIHAAAKRPVYDTISDSGLLNVLVSRGADPSRVERYDEDDWVWTRIGDQTYPVGNPLPLGTIVATCTLVDVAPIGGPFDFRTGSFEGDEGDFPGQPVVVRHPAMTDWLPERLMLDHGTVTDITDQLPYGDFTSGRYAWLLADVVPVDPPVPFKGGQGLTKTWTP